MASLKNVEKTKQRIHKERSQLFDRRFLGELEKKKDYQVRAKQQNKKRETLKALQQKALDRNPDEFYYHMINSKTEDGVHFEKEKSDDENSAEQEKLMRTQNLRYIIFKLGQERKKIDKLLSELHLHDPSKVLNKRKSFVDDFDEKPSGSRPIKTKKHPSLLTKKLNYDEALAKMSLEDLQNLDLERRQRYEELTKRIKREKELSIVAQKLNTTLLLNASKSKGVYVKKIKDGSVDQAPIYKWPLMRKK